MINGDVMKIGILGGSFNPPHNMHRDMALNLINNGYLDKVIFVPTGDFYKKRDLIDFIDRYNMVNLMIDGYDNLMVDSIGNSDNHQYTYQVLDYFKIIYPLDSIYFICGSDNLLEFDTWMNFEYILEKYNLLVVRRNKDNIDEIISKYGNYRDKIIGTNVKSSDLSSTYIRNNIGKDEILEYLDNSVLNYINNNKLNVVNVGYRLQRIKDDSIMNLRWN